MAEIKVKLSGDNSDFKRKLAEASAESRAKAAEMIEHFEGVKESIGEIGSDSGLGRIGGLLTGLTGGAVAFGAALLTGITKAVGEAMKLDALRVRMGTQLGSQLAGKDLDEFINSILTIGPNKEELMRSAGKLGEAKWSPEEIKRTLPAIQKLAIGRGLPAEEIAEEIAGGSVGITRKLEHDPMLRAIMKDFPGQDPVKALIASAMTPGGRFFNAINDALSSPSGKMASAGVAVAKTTEKAGEIGLGLLTGDMGVAFPDLFKDLPKYRGAPHLGTPLGSGSQGQASGIIIPISEAAKSLRESADKLNNVLNLQ